MFVMNSARSFPDVSGQLSQLKIVGSIWMRLPVGGAGMKVRRSRTGGIVDTVRGGVVLLDRIVMDPADCGIPGGGFR